MAGACAGLAALVIAAFLMLVVGIRLPLRLFFRVAGLLVYYLGFKFVGAGIHALQVAGVLPVSPMVPLLKEIPFFGFYPTWETLIPQMLLLVGAIFVVIYLHNLDQHSNYLNSSSLIKLGSTASQEATNQGHPITVGSGLWLVARFTSLALRL